MGTARRWTGNPQRRWRSATAAAAVLCLVTLRGTPPTRALSEGIIQASGKPPLLQTCDRCHFDGVVPSVRFEGPTAVAAERVARFRFVVTSASPLQRFAGFNVAASEGILDVVLDEGEQVIDDELTHTTTKSADDSGETSWQFTWCPLVAGAQTLYGAGNSVNGNGTPSGDASALATYAINVTAPVGDANCDGLRSAADVVSVLQQLGSATQPCATADANGDGKVDGADVSLIVAGLFPCSGSNSQPQFSIQLRHLSLNTRH